MLLVSPIDFRVPSTPKFHYCEPQWSWNARPQFYFNLWFIASGRGQAALGERVFDLHRGVCFVWRPGDTPVATHDKEHRLVVFAAHIEPIEAADSSKFELPYPVTVRDIPFFESTAHRIEALWMRGGASQTEASRLLGSLLWQLHDEMINTISAADAPLHDLVTKIRREPSRSWTIEEMARETFLSRAHFVRRFREVFSDSPAHFVLKIRIQRARSLVVDTRMTLQQIAESLGFCDAAHFSRAFKSWYGTSPGMERRIALGHMDKAPTDDEISSVHSNL